MSNSVTSLEVLGPVLALDLGEKLVGAAVSDERLITIRRLPRLERTNWKQLLRDVQVLVKCFDARSVVIGLPLRLDGTVGAAAENARRLAGNFAKSLSVPVFLQDERLTSFEARESLLEAGHAETELSDYIDSESAALILRDFINTNQDRTPLPEKGQHD